MGPQGRYSAVLLVFCVDRLGAKATRVRVTGHSAHCRRRIGPEARGGDQVAGAGGP